MPVSPLWDPRRVVSWRDGACERAQADLDGLLSVVLPFAGRTPSGHGGMFPFGAADLDRGLTRGSPGPPRRRVTDRSLVLSGIVLAADQIRASDVEEERACDRC